MRLRNRGFTLIELLTTLAVAAILLAVGVPAFAGLQQRARTDSSLHLLTAALAGARLAAVKLGQPVAVCPSSDGHSCTETTNWSGGWIMFVDQERSGQPETAASVLKRFQGIADGLALHSTRGRTQVRFTPNGWAYGSNLSIRLCNTAEARLLAKVVVNNAGRPRSERPETTTRCPYL